MVKGRQEERATVTQGVESLDTKEEVSWYT